MESSGKWYTAKIDAKREAWNAYWAKRQLIDDLKKDASRNKSDVKKQCIAELRKELKKMWRRYENLDNCYKQTEIPILLLSHRIKNEDGSYTTCYHWYIPDFGYLTAFTTDREVGFFKNTLDLRNCLMNDDFRTVYLRGQEPRDVERRREKYEDDVTHKVKNAVEYMLDCPTVTSWSQVRNELIKLFAGCPTTKDADDYVDYQEQ